MVDLLSDKMILSSVFSQTNTTTRSVNTSSEKLASQLFLQIQVTSFTTNKPVVTSKVRPELLKKVTLIYSQLYPVKYA